jgi:hypothetical protein
MPRYYFHLVGQGQTIPDRDGVEMTEDDEERLLDIIQEIRSEEPQLFDNDGWAMEVVTDSGRVVTTIQLSAASLEDALHAVAEKRRSVKQ